MEDKITNMEEKNRLTKKDKINSLFKYIKEINKIKQKIILKTSDYPWICTIKSIPEDDENIKVNYRDRIEDEDNENATNILLSVHKPEFQNCPDPDSIIKEWIEDGWNDFRQKIKAKDYILRPLNHISSETLKSNPTRIDMENQTYKEYFTDSKDRIESFHLWSTKRNTWMEKQLIILKTRDLFTDLYKICIDLERDSETLELVVADGYLRDRDLPELNHPILTRRVKIRHDAESNTIYIEDTDVETELYTVIFQCMENINVTSINHLRDELHYNDYHPLDRNDLPVFLKKFIYQLSSESIYIEDDIPENWQQKEKLLLYREPCYILRKRMDGALKAIEQIITHIEETGEVPAPLGDIVEGGKIDIPEDTKDISIEEQLAAVGGESVDILLSKEANKEQLEIARRIEKYNAVLVQGPPGTGKTHTIANLMGHFLAQGKSVLVTSHTQKALSVLKEKLTKGIQSLCVSMLDDSNEDMEKSIDGITNYMAQNTSFDLKREMEVLGQERKQIIHDLAETRKKIFSIINQEYNNIVYNGEEISPSNAAKFVQENIEKLSYIPGTVRLYEPLPLSYAELSDLYRSNSLITTQDENEFHHDLPNPNEIISPKDFEDKCNYLKSAIDKFKTISKNNQWEISNLPAENKIKIITPFGQLTVDYPEKDDVDALRNYVSSFPRIESWMKFCAIDGKKGSAYKQLWLRLIKQIEDTCECVEKLTIEKFGKDVQILSQDPNFPEAMKQLMEKYKQGDKIGKLSFLFNKQLEVALNGATVNGQKPQNSEDCQLILNVIKAKSMRDQCSLYWKDLMSKHGVPEFYDLDIDEPERMASRYIPEINRYLDWYQNEYESLVTCMNVMGLPCNIIFQQNILDSEIVETEKILLAIKDILPKICDIFEIVNVYNKTQKEIQRNYTILQTGKRANSDICKAIISATELYDARAYRDAFSFLQSTYDKFDLKAKREAYLKKLAPVAPQWADAIQNRNGIHGEASVPVDIFEAWKWKQYYGIIEDITSVPFADLQEKSLTLSKEYRRVTAKYAEKSAWFNLLQKTEHDISIKQALIGWKQTIKRIGKGTGKNVPMYRAKARELMVKCQEAVPAWIMPVNKALEILNPRTNKFDIVIIDEASQSNISSMAILYMGKKLIIVGDDKQVSPMAVGYQVEKMNGLKEMYIAGKIPNDHLYDAKTSIYDIAATTFQPLMLHEHFRCVPEIIGFSNWLSYDFKIKPLRDCSNSVLLPAVVNYRVKDGERIGKTNPNEAKAIVALMKACIEQPEYSGKTFGVISLLGDEQVKKIQEEIYNNFDPVEIENRRILCGNASNFQGDERDVVFLSVVDCANGRGPVTKLTEGMDDSNKKRYNVAASRARDQLWVVHSLDPVNDLKTDDIRKKLLDYSLNPESYIVINDQIEKKAESPFEAEVARYLVVKGYHLVQQWSVGAYRLDMVVVCGKKKVAIECDGERWHSGEEKIREDMERQTILERLGWQFIRIRGSEYYRDPIKTMENVVNELKKREIEPESLVDQEIKTKETDLLYRVKKMAHEIIYHTRDGFELTDNIIQAALDPKNDIIGTSIETPKDIIDSDVKKKSIF